LEANIHTTARKTLIMKLSTLTTLLIILISLSIHAQDGRIDTLLSINEDFEFIFRNNVDSNDVLTLDLMSIKKGENYVNLVDTTVQLQHKFYDDLYLEFDGSMIYKYVYDRANSRRYYIYTEDFTMPKGGRIELAYCLYKNVEYPEQAYQLRVEGLAFVQVYIDERGCVTKAKPLTRLGYGLEQELMKAVVKCGCSYEAGKRDGIPIKSVWNIPMRFEL
jgi:TonB family protein